MEQFEIFRKRTLEEVLEPFFSTMGSDLRLFAPAPCGVPPVRMLQPNARVCCIWCNGGEFRETTCGFLSVRPVLRKCTARGVRVIFAVLVVVFRENVRWRS